MPRWTWHAYLSALTTTSALDGLACFAAALQGHSRLAQPVSITYGRSNAFGSCASPPTNLRVWPEDIVSYFVGPITGETELSPNTGGMRTTFPAQLLHRARTLLHAPAQREKEFGFWQTFSWRALAELAEAFASGLAEAGLKRRAACRATASRSRTAARCVECGC